MGTLVTVQSVQLSLFVIKVSGEHQVNHSYMPKKKKAAAKASPKKDSYQSSMKKPSMKVVGPTAERPYKHYKG